jgi:hypothetical protein
VNVGIFPFMGVFVACFSVLMVVGLGPGLFQAVHDVAHLQHRLGAVWLLLEREFGAVLGYHGGVEGGLATPEGENRRRGER